MKLFLPTKSLKVAFFKVWKEEYLPWQELGIWIFKTENI